MWQRAVEPLLWNWTCKGIANCLKKQDVMKMFGKIVSGCFDICHRILTFAGLYLFYFLKGRMEGSDNFYHVCTNGLSKNLMFKGDDDFVSGMNDVPAC